MNSTPEKSPEFGVYTISKNYINHLRESQPCVADPEETNTYCGPVYRMNGKRGPADLFVPINVKEYEARNSFLASFIDGVFADIMDFKIMIPCLPSEYKLDTSRSDLTEFCTANEKLLKTHAAAIYKASKKHKI